MSPRSADAHIVKGHVLRAQKLWEEAILEYEGAFELNHNSAYALNDLGWCKLYEAIVWFEKARKASPGVPLIRSRLAAYALRGETERAASELAEARRLSGGGPFSSIARLKAYPNVALGVPKIRALYEATYFAGLRKAGMREE